MSWDGDRPPPPSPPLRPGSAPQPGVPRRDPPADERPAPHESVADSPSPGDEHPYGHPTWLAAPREAQHEVASPTPDVAPHEPPRRGFLQRIGAGIVGLFALLLKFGGLLVKLKFIGTAFTALISVGAYALFFGWKFAALFVLLLFVHEMGHVVQLRMEGVKATAPMFIPFFGAVVGMKEMPKNAWVEAKVGLAGPVFGAIGSAVVLALGEQMNSNLLRVVAYFSFLINLFNLAPVTPLDGGRAAAALHPAVWLAGLVGLVGLAFIHFSPFLLIIAVLAAGDSWARWKEFRVGGPAARDYYSVSPSRRVIVALTFAAVALACVLGMSASYATR